MPMYTQEQLQSFWNYYVTLKQADVIYYNSKESPGYDSNFAGMLAFIRSNKLFGFANYNSPQFFGNSLNHNGPTQS
jgi:hypothetical protein